MSEPVQGCDKRQNQEAESQIVICRRLSRIFLCHPAFMEIMSTREYIMKMTVVPIVTLMILSFILVADGVQEKGTKGRHVSIAGFVSGNDMYMAWPDNNTGYWNVFFAKSTDGGKTFKTMMISAPNKGNTIDQNTGISASGSNIYVTWWTNKTGILMPVFRASNDNGNTFGPITDLNSTSYRYCFNLKQCRPP